MKVSEDLHTIGNIHVTKVSAELKMARSLVRVADIQATLQEQRYGLNLIRFILYLEINLCFFYFLGSSFYDSR